MVIAIKLEKMVMGLQVAYTKDMEYLYRKAQAEGVDKEKWGPFLKKGKLIDIHISELL